MLDIKFIRENKDEVRRSLKLRNMDTKLLDELIAVDDKRRELVTETQELRAQRNEAAKAKDIEKGKKLKTKLQKSEPELKDVEKDYEEILQKFPNLVAPEVPEGKDESENKVLRSWGEPKKFSFKPKDHVEIGEGLGIIDVETSAKVSGSRFNYLFGDAVLLQFALVQFAFEILTDKKHVGKLAKSVENKHSTPFTPVVPPVIANADIMKKMDRFDPIEDRYYLEKDDQLLIGSAEHTLGPIHMDQVLSTKRLPIRYLGYSTAFRREAGTYGKDTKGILRVHQFDKLEMETFATKENGQKEQDLMVAIQEHFMQELDIPYQIMAICTGDMGKPDYRQIDLNAWLPGQNKYRETHTSDYMTDFQARRLNIKYNTKDGKEFVHMNDATALAIGRTLIAILENYQQKDGSVKVPKVLQKYVGKEKITPPKK